MTLQELVEWLKTKTGEIVIFNNTPDSGKTYLRITYYEGEALSYQLLLDETISIETQLGYMIQLLERKRERG